MNERSEATRSWVLVTPSDLLPACRPLLKSHECYRTVKVVSLKRGEALNATALSAHLEGAAGCLIIGDRRRSPRTAVPGLFVADANGRNVPIGWLPDVDVVECAKRTAKVMKRNPRLPGPVALLGQWQARYLHLARRMEVRLRQEREAPFEVFRWTAERATREELARGLRSGIGLAIYFGHGRPEGWAGYGGVRLHHLAGRRAERLAVLCSISCYTASRWRVGLSFSEGIVATGIASAAVGAVGPVSHMDNLRWMVGLAEVLCHGEILLGPALLRAAELAPGLNETYRLIGDPLTPMCGAPNSYERACKVWAPDPSESIGLGKERAL